MSFLIKTIKLANETDLKVDAQNNLKKLKLIAVALNKVQGNLYIITEAIEIWVKLMTSFEEEQEFGRRI